MFVTSSWCNLRILGGIPIFMKPSLLARMGKKEPTGNCVFISLELMETGFWVVHMDKPGCSERDTPFVLMSIWVNFWFLRSTKTPRHIMADMTFCWDFFQHFVPWGKGVVQWPETSGSTHELCTLIVSGNLAWNISMWRCTSRIWNTGLLISADSPSVQILWTSSESISPQHVGWNL